jgi:hypothetical protein
LVKPFFGFRESSARGIVLAAIQLEFGFLAAAAQQLNLAWRDL